MKILGFPIQFKDLSTVASAAQYRTAHWDNYQSGGLHPERRAELLRSLADSRTGRHRYVTCIDWHRQHGLRTLADCTSTVNRVLASSPKHFEDICSKKEPRPWTLKTFAQVKGSYQKAIARLLQDQKVYDAEAFLRGKLERLG